MANDVLKGRRTEIEFINGAVVEKAAEVGVPVPTQAAMLQLMRGIERGAVEPGVANLARF